MEKLTLSVSPDQNAELTVIAAAGDDSGYGLPGIGSRLRCGQRTFLVGKFDIISTMGDPHSKVKMSKWSTRGWTFQEAALSRRRLVFTDDQVYFECNAMNCHESLSSNIDKLHIKNKSKFKESMRAGLFGGTEKRAYGGFDEPKISLRQNFVRFMGMVEQYTARDLTKDADSLNAFAGVIHNFEEHSTSMSQIWGVPFHCGQTEGGTAGSFVDGLAWSHKSGLIDERGRPRHRPEFPSWSWAGWAGEVEYEDRKTHKHGQLVSEECYISVDSGGGFDAKLSEYYRDYISAVQVGSDEPIAPRVIKVQTLALPPSAISCNDSTSPPRLRILKYPARLALSTGPWDIPHFYQSVLSTNQRQCIYLGQLQDKIFVMVLEAQKDHVWSRVGLIFLDEVWYWDFHKSWEAFKTKSNKVKDKDFLSWKHIDEEAKLFRIV